MTLLENFKKRVADIGFRNTVSLILKNKVYRHIDRLFLAVGKRLWKNAPLRDTLVLESHNDFDCNGGAFYDYLIENGYNERYRIVWLVKHKKPRRLPKNVQCFNIFHPSLRKTYHICTAKFLSCDDVITEKVRPEQKSFYLTHGVFGLKDVRGKILIPESVDYVLAASPLLDAYEAEQISISRHAERLIHVGVPCHDLLLGGSTGELKKVTDGSFDKVILWMPTFRKSDNGQRNDGEDDAAFDVPAIDSLEEYEAVNRALAAHNTLLIIKLHPMQNLTHLQIGDRSHIAVLTRDLVKRKGIDNYRLMRECDALISDYSSAVYDYLQLGRPVAFVFSDLQTYKLGVAVPEFGDFEYFVPGEVIKDGCDLANFIAAVADGCDDYREKREELRSALFQYRDTHSAQRLADFMGLSRE